MFDGTLSRLALGPSQTKRVFTDSEIEFTYEPENQTSLISVMKSRPCIILVSVLTQSFLTFKKATKITPDDIDFYDL